MWDGLGSRLRFLVAMTNWSTYADCCSPIADDPEGFEPEHVVPSAIGGNLTVPSGAKCNREMGKHFDQPMLDDRHVLISRAVCGIRPMPTSTPTSVG